MSKGVLLFLACVAVLGCSNAAGYYHEGAGAAHDRDRNGDDAAHRTNQRSDVPPYVSEHGITPENELPGFGARPRAGRPVHFFVLAARSGSSSDTPAPASLSL